MPTSYDLQWINANMTRNYPLADDATGIATNGSVLPTQLIADMFIYAPPSVDVTFSGNFFVSQVSVTDASMLVQISYKYGQGAQQSFIVARAVGIPVTLEAGTQVQAKTFMLSAATDVLDAFKDSVEMGQYYGLRRLYGSIVIGANKDCTLPSLPMAYQAGKISPICVRSGLACVERIKVGSVSVDGEVILQAGSGIVLSVTQQLDGSNVILIQVDQSAIGQGLTSVAQAKAAIMAQFGAPVKSINNASPDSSGNISIQGLDCVDIRQGTASISIENSCSKPCCDPSTTQDIAAAQTQLQARYQTLNTFYTNISNTINLMASRLSAVIASR